MTKTSLPLLGTENKCLILHSPRHIMQAFSELSTFLCFFFCWHKKIPCILYIYSHPTTSRSPYCLHQLVGMKIHTQRNLLPHLLPLLIHRWSIFHSSRVYCEEYFTPPEPFSSLYDMNNLLPGSKSPLFCRIDLFTIIP